MTAIAGPPLETLVPWECLTRVCALLPWLGRPFTPHFCMPDPEEAGVAILHQLNRVSRGGTVHCKAGTTWHVAMAVLSRQPLPHTQAGRKPLLTCHLHLRVRQTDNTRHTPHRRAWPRTIIHETSNSPTKLVCDARAKELVSHRLAQPTTTTRSMLQSGHLGIALHPLVHPASRAGSASRR